MPPTKGVVCPRCGEWTRKSTEAEALAECPQRDYAAEGKEARMGAEMRSRVIEHDTGSTTPWSAWAPLVTSPPDGLTGRMLDAVGASVRDTVASDCYARTTVARQINGPDGKAIRTVEYQLREAGETFWDAAGDPPVDGGDQC